MSGRLSFLTTGVAIAIFASGHQVVMSRTPGFFRTVLVPQGTSKPEWLTS
jgi:hypothetical protein